MPKTTEEMATCVLEEAARYMEENGWVVGDFEEDDGSVCLIGSISKVMFGVANPEDADQPDKAEVFDVAVLPLRLRE